MSRNENRKKSQRNRMSITGLPDSCDILPSQWGLAKLDRPERKLILAMLEQTKNDACSGGRRRSTAWAWIDDWYEGLFSFDHCCRAIGVSPDFARRHILAA